MTEIVIESRTLPEPLLRFIHTDKVKVKVSDGIISLFPFDSKAENAARPPLDLLEGYTDYAGNRFLE